MDSTTMNPWIKISRYRSITQLIKNRNKESFWHVEDLEPHGRRMRYCLSCLVPHEFQSEADCHTTSIWMSAYGDDIMWLAVRPVKTVLRSDLSSDVDIERIVLKMRLFRHPFMLCQTRGVCTVLRCALTSNVKRSRSCPRASWWI